MHQKKTFIRIGSVCDRTGQSRSSVYRGVKNNTFPQPVSIGENSIAWVEDEVDGWVLDRIAKRDQALAATEAA